MSRRCPEESVAGGRPGGNLWPLGSITKCGTTRRVDMQNTVESYHARYHCGSHRHHEFLSWLTSHWYSVILIELNLLRHILIYSGSVRMRKTLMPAWPYGSMNYMDPRTVCMAIWIHGHFNPRTTRALKRTAFPSIEQ